MSRGFTLPELLVAIALLGVVGVLSWRGVDGLQRAAMRSETTSERWRAVARGMDKMVIDLRQITSQPLPNDVLPRAAWYGVPMAAGDRLEFMRAPLIDDQPLQRMGYRRGGDALEMFWWPAGAPADAAPRSEPLIAAVSGFEVRYLGADLRWHDRWPLPQLDPQPRAISLRVMLAEGDRLERVVALP